MPRLIAYFCSYGYSGSAFTKWGNNAAPSIVAKHYGLEFVNKSVPGTSVHKQFEAINKDFDSGYIDADNDKILVQWTFSERAYMVGKQGSYQPWTMDDPKEGKHIEWYYANVYDETLANSQILSYASILHDILRGNVYQGFMGGYKMKGMHPRILYNSVMRKINCIAFNESSMMEELKQNVHPTDALYECLHPKDIGHEYIAKKYIEGIDSV